jgi:hypothetical protein
MYVGPTRRSWREAGGRIEGDEVDKHLDEPLRSFAVRVVSGLTTLGAASFGHARVLTLCSRPKLTHEKPSNTGMFGGADGTRTRGFRR